MTAHLTIERIGHLGDGIAQSPQGPVAVPFTAPGDVVVQGPWGDWSCSVPGENRAEPPCQHFGRCGGCALQHVAQPAYLAAKRGWLVEGLARQGIKDADVRALVPVAPGTRRRATLSVRWDGVRAALGFHEARGRRIVALEECPVLSPPLVAALPFLARLAERVVRRGEEARITLSAFDNGLEAAFVSTAADPLALFDAGLSDELSRLRIIRIAWNGAVLFESEPAVLSLGGVAVRPPPGAFFQATREAEMALRAGVSVHLEPARRIADLYAGLGTFALPLAQSAKREVTAFEGEAEALRSLIESARACGLGHVKGVVRDLARRPLTAKDLAGSDAAVIDPPRGGAEAQVEALAHSSLERIAYVSCNPASFAHDARLLVEGGFRLDWVQPVDQFVWSLQLELVAGFTRKKTAKKRPFHPRLKRSSAS